MITLLNIIKKARYPYIAELNQLYPRIMLKIKQDGLKTLI